ncbi:MAG: pyridoxal-phosphate dependent enzyme [Burkholderiales bacterium]|jgi:threonine dehydratase|nr:pyridoxal-phosphate dependent enzyme [Burkholderiales bacterium]
MIASRRLDPDRIARAAREIDPVFLHSPQYVCEPLAAWAGVPLVIKVETLNPIRSFKGRGADWFLTDVVDRADPRALVCASAGNWGQALAYACRRRGRSLTIWAAENANALKVERMRALGATVHLEGDDFDAAKACARAHCEASGAWLVEDGLEPAISEGAGSIAVELLRVADSGFDAIVAPLGNGALLAGIAHAVRAFAPTTRVFGVCASGADAMAESWRSGRVVVRDRIDTIADGIGVRVPIPQALDDLAGMIDDVLRVDDTAILDAMRAAHRHAGLVLEPAGAAGLAAVRVHAARFAGQRVATVLCGGNLAPADFGWLQAD